MTLGYGISGISPLGTYGLGATGGYGSYDAYMPSMYMGNLGLGMGINDSIFGMGALGNMGAYGNWMLQYPMYYTQMQGQIENMQLQHAMDMQRGINQYGVVAHDSSVRAYVQKLINSGDIEYGIENLYRKVKEGDQNGIMKQYNELREFILNTYGEEFNTTGKNHNRISTANEIIKDVYAATISAKTGNVASLEDDIVKYGDGAAMNGFKKGFRLGHHESYVDETLQYCFGREIDEQKHKDIINRGTSYLGRGAQVLEKAGIGYLVGAGTFTAGKVLAKGIAKSIGKGSKMTWFNWSNAGKVGLAAAAALAIADIFWQISDSKNS